jgi:hypothetical protein
VVARRGRTRVGDCSRESGTSSDVHAYKKVQADIEKKQGGAKPTSKHDGMVNVDEGMMHMW